MLQSIRDNAQGIFVWVVVGLIIISFALFGLGSYLSGASKVVTASVNGVEISDTEVTRAYRNYQERLMKMFGDQYRPEMFNEQRLKQEVLQGLITQEVLNQMMADNRYHPAASQVFSEINKIEAFQEEGKFSTKRYKEVLGMQGMNSEMFENDIARNITSEQIRDAIKSSAFLTKNERDTIATLNNQQREIGYFKVSVNNYQKSVTVSDDEIKTYYDTHAERYQTPEKVKLEYIELSLDDIAKQQEVSEESIKQHYEAFPANYMTDNEEAARNALTNISQKLFAGEKFADLAKKYSQDTGTAKQGGDLGYITKGLMDKSFDDAVFALKKGQVSQIVKSAFGFHLIKLEDIRQGDPEERKVSHILIKPEQKLKALVLVKDEIRKELQFQQASKLFYDDADKMNNLSYESPDSLAPVADALGLKIKTSQLITRQGGEGTLSNPKVLTAAFSDEVLKQRRNSELLELSDTQLMVLRVSEHVASSVKPLKQVSEMIKQQLIREKANQIASKTTSDVLALLKDNKPVAEIQKTHTEVEWIKPAVIARTVKEKSVLPASVRSKAFSMTKPTGNKVTWDSTAIGGGSYAVIGLYKIIEKTTSMDDAKELDKYINALGANDYEAFVQNLKSQADISVTARTAE